jgi:hypothetical protein
MPTTHRLRRITGLVAALPLVMGAFCGLAVDFTETFLITDPVDLIVIDVDDGNIDAVAYDRPAILLKRHTFGYERKLGEPTFTVEDGVASFEAHCKDGKESICTFDHMFELPFGVGFDITMLDARIDLGYVDANITASFVHGFFHGVQLQAPSLEIEARSAEVDLDYAAVPETIAIDLDKGSVAISLPTGEYQCLLDADAGEVSTDGITCDDAATAVLDVHLGHGDITVTGVMP